MRLASNRRPDLNRQSVDFGAGRSYRLDLHGFLDPPEQWDDDFARGMAAFLGIEELTAAHWDFIRYLRCKFIIDRTVPPLVLACAENRLRLARLEALFPPGYHRGACRIAGINHAVLFEQGKRPMRDRLAPLRRKYAMTPAGFLENFDEWDEQFARRVIAESGRKAQAEHWRVLRYLRKQFKDHGLVPTAAKACRACRMSLKRLHELFPEGYRRGACRTAGLPFFC